MKRGNYIGVVGLFLTLIAVSALLPSCREKPAISNQIVVTAIGLEKRGKEIELSIQAVEALKTSSSLSEQSENATAVYTAKANSVAAALQEFLNEAGRSTYILHNQVIGLGEAIIREDSLFETLDYFFRNPEGRSLVDVVVCRNEPSSLLGISSGNDAIPAEYVAQLLQEGERVGTAVSARLLDIQRSASGMYDVMLPIVEIHEEKPRLNGTMLFKGGYAAGELTEAQTTALLYAADRIDTCLHTVEGVTFSIARSATRLNITPYKDGYTYEFLIDSRAKIVESDRDLTEKEKRRLITLLEERCASQVSEAVEKTVVVYGCDPLGLARQTAREHQNVTQGQAAELLSQGRYEAKAKIHLIESGFLR